MKLRNKKTGEIGELAYFDSKMYILIDDELKTDQRYDSLAELNEEWEDYEETETVWYIDFQGLVRCAAKEENDWFKESEIGNYFLSREEAELAVRKLEAWKRLKDAGFRFDGYDVAHNSNGDLCGQLFYNAGDYCIEDVEKDLDLLFGGEE